MVQADVGFLWDKATVFGVTTRETSCIYGTNDNVTTQAILRLRKRQKMENYTKKLQRKEEINNKQRHKLRRKTKQEGTKIRKES
jgi:hypothetical protein